MLFPPSTCLAMKTISGSKWNEPSHLMTLSNLPGVNFPVYCGLLKRWVHALVPHARTHTQAHISHNHFLTTAWTIQMCAKPMSVSTLHCIDHVQRQRYSYFLRLHIFSQPHLKTVGCWSHSYQQFFPAHHMLPHIASSISATWEILERSWKSINDYFAGKKPSN